MALDTTYNAINQGVQGGSLLTIGGTLDIASSGKLTVAGVDKTGNLTNSVGTPISGLTTGNVFAAGTAAFSASGTLLITTGLTTLTSIVILAQGAGTSNISTQAVFYEGSILSGGTGGSANVYAYGQNGTAIATSKTVNWLARGA